MIWRVWYVDITRMHKYRFRPTWKGIRYMLHVFKTCIGVISYTPNHRGSFFLRIWLDLGQNIFSKFMKFCQISEKYTFFHSHEGGDNSFRPSLKSPLGFEYGIEIASMGHLDNQAFLLSLATCLSYGLNANWNWMVPPTYFENLEFIKFFMKKCYKQKELRFGI